MLGGGYPQVVSYYRNRAMCRMYNIGQLFNVTTLYLNGELLKRLKRVVLKTTRRVKACKSSNLLFSVYKQTKLTLGLSSPDAFMTLGMEDDRGGGSNPLI